MPKHCVDKWTYCTHHRFQAETPIRFEHVVAVLQRPKGAVSVIWNLLQSQRAKSIHEANIFMAASILLWPEKQMQCVFGLEDEHVVHVFFLFIFRSHASPCTPWTNPSRVTWHECGTFRSSQRRHLSPLDQHHMQTLRAPLQNMRCKHFCGNELLK